jgi:hypothetical protein
VAADAALATAAAFDGLVTGGERNAQSTPSISGSPFAATVTARAVSMSTVSD